MSLHCVTRNYVIPLAVLFWLVLCSTYLPSIELLRRQYGLSADNDIAISYKNHSVTPEMEEKSLQIAWLASFPNSGTSFTLEVVRKASHTRVATNYASLRAKRNSMMTPPTPVFEDQPTGPFWSDDPSSSYSYPDNYVLTKTHCGALCVDCAPEKYLRMLHEFRISCFSGEQLVIEDGKRSTRHVFYPPLRVGKAIHLYRSPLDNVVARFRYETLNNRSATGYERTRNGFREYCLNLNKQYGRAELDGRFMSKIVWNILRDVPCRMEFVKYIEWHNMATVSLDDMGLDVMVLHYDWYEIRFNQTIQSLLDFLGLDYRSEPTPFISGKNYGDYFTESEHDSIASALKLLSFDAVWQHVGGYVRFQDEH